MSLGHKLTIKGSGNLPGRNPYEVRLDGEVLDCVSLNLTMEMEEPIMATFTVYINEVDTAAELVTVGEGHTQ